MPVASDAAGMASSWRRPKPLLVGRDGSPDGASDDPFTFKTSLFDDDQGPLSDEWRRQAERLFGETTNEEKTAKIEALRSKLAQSNPQLLVDLPGPDNGDMFLLRVLRASRGYSVSNSATILGKYVEMMTKSPQFFDLAFNRFKGVEEMFEAKIGTVLPYRDQWGRRVMIGRGCRWNPVETSLEDLFCMVWMNLEMLAREEKGQIAGLTVLVDAAGFGWRQMRGVTLEGLLFCLNLLQETYPLWIRHVSVLNAPWLFQKMYEWVRPWMHEEVREMLHFHDTIEDLHQHIDKSVLPEEYGGEVGPFDLSEMRKCLMGMEDYFGEIKKYVEQK